MTICTECNADVFTDVSTLLEMCSACREDVYTFHEDCGNYSVDNTGTCLYCANPGSGGFHTKWLQARSGGCGSSCGSCKSSCDKAYKVEPIKVIDKAVNDLVCIICKRNCSKADKKCWHCGNNPHPKAK